MLAQSKNSCTFEMLQSVNQNTELLRNNITPLCVWFVIPYGFTGCSDLPTLPRVFYFNEHLIF